MMNDSPLKVHAYIKELVDKEIADGLSSESITARNIREMTTKVGGRGEPELDITSLRVAIHSCKLLGQHTVAAKLEKELERRGSN